ncbi:DUF4258 domain-containing protein, partial [Listeria monocytogenes]|nr:DUF4258 domain-containing protein [Listeria monocytogenes]
LLMGDCDRRGTRGAPRGFFGIKKNKALFCTGFSVWNDAFLYRFSIVIKKMNRERTMMKTTYKINSRKMGPVYIAFSEHARQRMEERQIDLLDVLMSLTEQVETLVINEREGDTLLINPRKNLSIVLSISETQKDIKYLNIITLLNDIPLTADGQQLRFHDIAQCVFV